MPEETNRSGSIYGGAAGPCAVILFGASGDLAKRKVIPAMYDLAQYKSLGERYAIIGFAHGDIRGHAAADRQLALGGRAVLPAVGQAHGAPRPDSRMPAR